MKWLCNAITHTKHLEMCLVPGEDPISVTFKHLMLKLLAICYQRVPSSVAQGWRSVTHTERPPAACLGPESEDLCIHHPQHLHDAISGLPPVQHHRISTEQPDSI